MNALPLIGVSACTSRLGHHLFHIAGDKYLKAVADVAIPIIIPALAHDLHKESLLARLDGLLFTGSPSNVEPHLYQEGAVSIAGPHDPARDSTTLPLIQMAIASGIPVMGICRGFQEMNVALGGTLHQKVHEAGPYRDHREPADEPVDIQYGLSHELHIQPGGLLASLGLPERIQVNSLHGQGVERLGPNLRIEAKAPDGLIEAFSVEHASTFALGVQWHPEWQVQNNPHYRAIFKAFTAACSARAQRRQEVDP